jgi:hypothetical protein
MPTQKKDEAMSVTLVCAECFAVLDADNTKKHAAWHDKISGAIVVLHDRLELLEARVPYSESRTRVIERGIAEALELLKPDVVRIRYDVDEDYTGDPCINIRVLLTDAAAKYSRKDNEHSPLFESARRAERVIEEHVRPRDIGLLPYWSMRSVSEQEKLKEECWE